MPVPLARLVLLAALLAVAGCETPAAPASRDAEAVEEKPSGPGAALAPFPDGVTEGALVYVPVYSHIYHGEGTNVYSLAATLSVRNVDPERALTVAAVSYYDSEGRLVREYLDAPTELGPLATRSYVVPVRDDSGGSGANFMVSWSARAAVTEPLIESVMISTASSQGLSFTGAGRVVRRVGAGG